MGNDAHSRDQEPAHRRAVSALPALKARKRRSYDGAPVTSPKFDYGRVRPALELAKLKSDQHSLRWPIGRKGHQRIQRLAHSTIFENQNSHIPHTYSQASCTFAARNRDYPVVYAHEIHAYEVHAHEVYACEMHAHEVHACEMHVYEVHAHEVKSCRC